MHLEMRKSWTRPCRAAAFFGSALIALFVVAAPRAVAQDFPSHTVRIIVPFAAGGGVDIMARSLAEYLGKKWNQTVIVENITGGNATIGTRTAATAKPDGHTLLFSTDQSINASYLIKNIGYDPFTDLTPVTMITDATQIVIANPSVPANTLPALVAYARQNPGRLNYGSYGTGSAVHLLFEGLKAEAKIDLAHVPYRGASQVFAAIASNEVQLALIGTQSGPPLQEAGKIKYLAIDRVQRHPQFPDVPTLAEAGYPDIGPRPWYGVLTTGGTPAAIVQKIQRDITEIITSTEFDDRFLKRYGYIPESMTVEAFAAFLKKDFNAKGRLFQSAGVKPE
jgi:tripartite-type tricarboxylate transporter receptor subunit TctC